jgi:serine phosphatase RsbU (regulator of sigma subunit)
VIETSSRRRPEAASIVVVVVGLAVTVALALAARTAHSENEDRLLQQRTREAAAVLEAAVPGVEAPLASTAGLVGVVEGGDPDMFRSALGAQVGGKARFVSASVWPVDGTRPTVVLGADPKLADRPADEVRAFLARAAETPGLVVHGMLTGDAPRLGYAFAGPEGGGRFLVYAEQALPTDKTSVVQSGSAFEGLDYAVYLGSSSSPSTLLFASTDHLPFPARQAVEQIPFGDGRLRLVMSPDGNLGGSLLASLQWLVLATGTVTTVAAGVATEVLQRRRRRAEQLAADNARLYSEQREGSQLLQRSLLPRELPELDGVEVAVRYAAGVAGTQVGGDWYDVIDNGDTMVVVVGDVSGRGLTAASVMASVRYTVRTLAAQGLPPGEVLATSNRLDEGQHPGHFATVICGVVDRAARTLTFACAGHPWPLLLSDGEARWIDVPIGPPIGAGRHAVYDTVTVPIPEHATLLLVTDGLFERRGETIDVGLERLRAAAAPGGEPLPALLDRLVDQLTAGRAADDAAILAVRWRS